MSTPFKMKGWSPFTQKPTKTYSTEEDQPGYGKGTQYKGEPASKERQAYDTKINNLLEKIEFIKEDAHKSKSGELTDAQKSQIAGLQKQAAELRKTKP